MAFLKTVLERYLAKADEDDNPGNADDSDWSEDEQFDDDYYIDGEIMTGQDYNPESSEGGGDGCGKRRRPSSAAVSSPMSTEDKDQPRFQKALWQIRHLPYADEVDKEADLHLGAIKTGLATSILMREVKPGLLHWIIELDKYISLHSRRFTKADHIWFIQTFYCLLQMKSMDYRIVKVLCQILTTLLAKRELLSRSDLQLDWRPLYDLYYKIAYKKIEEDGLLLLPDQFKTYIQSTIYKARNYFPLTATREILEEVMPLFCPWDASILQATDVLALFLPTCLSCEDHESHGAALWFDELWRWYSTVENSPPWEQKLIYIFARLAKECPEYIDWSQYMEVIFTRIMRSFELQLGGSGGMDAVLIGSGPVSFPADASAQLIAYMIGGENRAMPYLKALFRAIESYLYPSNNGKWVSHLMAFMLKLTNQLCLRLHRERHRKPDWTPSFSQKRQLTDQQIDDFVQVILPCAIQGIFTKSRGDLSAGIIRFLAMLAPKLVLPAVLEKLYPSLETLTEPHRLLQSLNSIVAVCIAIVRSEGSPVSPLIDGAMGDGGGQTSRSGSFSVSRRQSKAAELAASRIYRRKVTKAPLLDEMGMGGDRGARLHCISLMFASLPGLDANDIGKTMLTFQMLGLFCALIPLVDCSDAIHVREDLTEEEKDLCSATANLNDFVNQLMDKMFNLIEIFASQSHSGVHGGSGSTALAASRAFGQSMEEMMLKNGIFCVYRTLVGNCSTEIYKVAADRLLSFVSENVFESRVAADTIAEMIFCVVRTNPGESLPKFLELIKSKLAAHILEETYKEDEADSTLLWYLVLCSQLVRTAGNHLLKHRLKLTELIRLVLPLKAKEAYQLVSVIVEHLMIAFNSVYLTNFESQREKLDQPVDKFLAIRHWAPTCNKKTVSVIWHVPDEQEMEFVNEILQMVLFEQLELISKPDLLTKEDLERSLSLIKACVAGSAINLPMLEGDLVPVVESLVDFAHFTYQIVPTNVKLTAPGGRNLRNVVFERLHHLCEYMLKHREDDAKALVGICRIYGYLIYNRGLDKSKYDAQVKGFQMSRRIVGDVVRGRKADVESITHEFILIQHHKRLLARSSYSFNEVHRQMVFDLIKLATSHYSSVRKEAQAQLEMCFYHFPYVYRLFLDEIISYLKDDKAISHEQLKATSLK